MKKYFKFLIVVLAMAVVVPQIALAAWWNPVSWGLWGRIWSILHKQQTPVACTMEAKLCPDSSSVGRQGPKCEFAPCPEKKDDTAGWKTYTNTEYGFEFKYPANFLISNENKQIEYFTYKVWQVASAYQKKDNYKDNSTFNVFVTNNASDIKNCLKDPSAKDLTKTKNINGNNFYIVSEKQGDAAMGGARGVGSEYHILHNNYCYIIQNSVYYHLLGYAGVINKGKSDATPQELQEQQNEVEKSYKNLEDILSTFKFTNSQPIVGGDKDAHGCIGSAGYSWCEAKQKCLRTWEETCN